MTTADINLKDASRKVFEAVHKSIELKTIEGVIKELWNHMVNLKPRAVMTWPYADVAVSFPRTFKAIFKRMIADEAKAERVFTEFFKLVGTAPIREGYHRMYVHKDELRLVTIQ